jgi:glycosyltransferase involved in cell wall biosynthesis
VTRSPEAAPAISIPAISIVVATYNRSRALRCAIESARRQTWTDWEMIVVGDACTDDTAAVVAEFADRRIRFVNLAINFGDQSGPNNVGVARSSGRLIAFLNHDDLWFPDHLQTAVDWLEASGADLVHALAAGMPPMSPSELDSYAWGSWITGFGRRGRYDAAATFAAASTWVFRRELALRVGPWRAARDCIAESSQEWLYRALRAGAQLVSMPHLSVVLLHSGGRRDAYPRNEDSEQAWYLRELAHPAFRAHLLARYPFSGTRGHADTESWGLALWRAGLRAAGACGISPRALSYRISRRMRRGEYIAMLRAKRGLDPMGSAGADSLRKQEVGRLCDYRPGDVIEFGLRGDAVRHQALGWSMPEPAGTWTDGPTAELWLRIGTPIAHDLLLTAEVSAFVSTGNPAQHVPAQHVGVSANDVALAEWSFGVADEWRVETIVIPRVVASARAPLRLRFAVRFPGMPQAADTPANHRALGIRMRRLSLSERCEQ